MGPSSPIFGVKVNTMWNHHPVVQRTSQQKLTGFHQGYGGIGVHPTIPWCLETLPKFNIPKNDWPVDLIKCIETPANMTPFFCWGGIYLKFQESTRLAPTRYKWGYNLTPQSRVITTPVAHLFPAIGKGPHLGFSKTWCSLRLRLRTANLTPRKFSRRSKRKKSPFSSR